MPVKKGDKVYYYGERLTIKRVIIENSNSANKIIRKYNLKAFYCLNKALIFKSV